MPPSIDVENDVLWMFQEKPVIGIEQGDLPCQLFMMEKLLNAFSDASDDLQGTRMGQLVAGRANDPNQLVG